MTKVIFPHWPHPKRVFSCSSTRMGGVSLSPYDSLNLGMHCGDNPEHVAENRNRFYRAAGLPSQPVWLEQVHGKEVLKLTGDSHFSKRADASYSNVPGTVCAVMTADCLPVLFCNISGNEVAAAHAGWRGLCDDVLEETVTCFKDRPENIMAWLGPAIGPAAFEVGPEVREAFIKKDLQATSAFRAVGEKYFANIFLLALQRLVNVGITQVYGGECCTWTESDKFFSYRRDGKTGRMASFIWLR